ncbi:N-acetylneuraminate synthase family protein [Bacillus spizizenii]|nr:N-acetylneuraminate synthase family protein [Bacillus spizizenii]MCY8629195.1 N-acetylneuraminate synthase family protein [Bacillus spizizenii]
MENSSLPEKVKVIAEIANAHQGKEESLKALIKAAAESGADGVKFQWFKYDCIATPCFFAYESYIELFLNEDVWKNCVAYGKRLGLEIWVDIFDSWGAELFLHLQHDIDGIKLPTTILQSTEIMKTIGMTEKPVLIGIGGWYEEEIDQMMSLVKQHMANQLILMHGFQGYPTKLEDINLKRIQHLQKRYKVQIGFADHIDADHPLAADLPVYAFFSGAAVIEKHITLHRAAKGYDYYSSLEPNEFKLMTEKLQQAQIATGSPEVNASERKYLHDSSLRVTANQNIKKGEIITLNKTSSKRCGNENALMPLQAEDAFPQVATADLSLNQPITPNEIKSSRIAIAVICRLKSTRLPKKALLPIYGIPSVERCLINCLAVPGVHEVVLATSNLPEDDPLEAFTLNGKVRIVRGAPENVADRMLEAAALTKADIIIRVTGDCPVVSPEVLQYLIDRHLQKGADYTQELSSSAGISGNVITVEALQRLVQQPKPLTHTEYLSFYFLNNPSLFSINQVSLPEELHYPSWRLTLDEPKDLELFEQIYRNLDVKNEPLYFSQIRDYLSANQHVSKINQDVSTKWIDQTSLVEEINKATLLLSENK